MAHGTVPPKEPIFLPGAETEYIQMGWGTLTWYASNQLGNSDTLTVGKCLIFPSQANALHFHPNCDEILTVLQGHIKHTWKDGTEVEMREGDTITIPSGVLHQARNIGAEDAILIIVFSSADRRTIRKGIIMHRVHLTILNSMAGKDFEQALDIHLQWGLRYLDLKDEIFGKQVEQLTPAEAAQAARLIESRRLTTHTLSTSIFCADIEEGEAAFRNRFAEALERIINTARILRPHVIRLLAAKSSRRAEFSNAADYISAKHPWVYEIYGTAIDRLTRAGCNVAIENETRQCIFAHPGEIADFFIALGRPVRLIWDIANLWRAGTFPTVEVYTELKPLIGLVHVKGGRAVKPCGELSEASSLADASWDVSGILRAILRDGMIDVLCLNPAHGTKNERYSGSTTDFYNDLVFLRERFPEII